MASPVAPCPFLSPRVPLWIGALLLGTAAVAGGAFERGPFADPLAAPERLGANPARLASATAAVCGHVGHDRPFGLQELAGHNFLVAAPGIGRARTGFGLAVRGPPQHREQAILAGVAASLTRGLDLGAGVLEVRLTRTGQPAWRARVPVLGARAGAIGGWQVEGWWHGASGDLLERRVSVGLRHEGPEGTLSLGVRWRGPAARPEVRLTLPLGGRAAMTLDGLDRPRQYGFGLGAGVRSLRMGVHLRTHHQLGATPSWSVGRACR